MILEEGGNATAKWGTDRATQRDIQVATRFVAATLGVPDTTIIDGLLGSTEMTRLGYNPDSGDVDIALQSSEHDMHATHQKMLAALNKEGVLSPGIKVGSYAVPVSSDKKIQVDLMFFDDAKWAKFMYHSDIGRESKYKGAVRNIVMIAVVRHMMKPGDLVVQDEDGNVIARAKYSLDVTKGVKRSYKIAPIGKNGARVKTLKAVSPQELELELEKLGPQYKNTQINKAEDLINDPDAVVQFVFGPNYTAKDAMTAEQVLTLLKDTDTIDAQLKTVIAKDAMITLDRAGIKYPPELKKLAS